MAVLQYKIPEVYQPGFVILANMSDDSFSRLQPMLVETKISETEESLAAKLVEPLSISQEDAKILSSTIFSLYYLLLVTNSTIPELASGLGIAFRSFGGPQTNDDEEKRLTSRIETIISLKTNLFYTVKSKALYGESLSIFEDCKVITDIRLTFDNQSIDQGYKGGMVVHNLKLVFRENDESINMVITCLSKDLDKMKAAIDRALDKEKLIKEGNLSKEIIFVDIKGNEQ
jgi:hypothetical protein